MLLVTFKIILTRAGFLQRVPVLEATGQTSCDSIDWEIGHADSGTKLSVAGYKIVLCKVGLFLYLNFPYSAFVLP